MKCKIILLVSIVILSSWNTFSQSSNIFNFTLQVRVDGEVIDNDKNKNIVVTIYKADKSTAVFSETISNVSTNSVGICKLKIGSGIPILTGNLVDFSSIDWNYTGYTIGFKWDGKDVRGGAKSRLTITPYVLSASLTIFVDTLRAKLADTIIVAEDLDMSQENIFNLNTLSFKNSENIDNNVDGVIKVSADTTEFTGILKFNNKQFIDNSTIGQLKIVADSTYIPKKLKIDTLQSSTSADVIFNRGVDLTNNNISDIKALNINPATKSYSGITTNGEVVLTAGAFARPLYLASDGKYKLSDNSQSDKSSCVALTINSEISNTQLLLLHGYIKNVSWNFTKGDLIYINSDSLSNIKPIISTHFVQQVGYAVDVNIIYFNPLEETQIEASVVISPTTQQILKVKEKSTPFTVTEIPNAQSRKWYYGTSENGPFDKYFSANDNEISIQVVFGSINTYFVVCKSTYESGEIITSNPIKVFCGKTEVTPNLNQTIKINTHSSNQLTLLSSPIATAYQWVYDSDKNGTYSSEILDSTNATFTPIFDKNGIFYVKCKSTINDTYIYSNSVKVFVSGFSLTPSEDQLLNLGESSQTITVNDALTDTRVWIYSQNIEGPFVSLVPLTEVNPQSVSTDKFPEGVNYVICKSGGVASNPVKITVVANLISPLKQFTTRVPKVLTLNYGKTKPDSWMWYRGVNKNNISTPMNSLITETPISMYMSDSLFYFVKAKYGIKEIVSNIASIYSGLEITSGNKMVIRQGMTDTIDVKFRVKPDDIKWFRVGSTTELTNTLADKSRLVPVNASKLIPGQKHKVYCQANYGGVIASSDTVDMVITNFEIADKTNQLIDKINKLGNVLSIASIAPVQSSLKWFVQKGGIFTPINGEITKSYIPIFEKAGEYKVFCEITYPEGIITTDTVTIDVLDLRIRPNEKQVLYADVDLTNEVSFLTPPPVGATKEWFIDNVSYGDLSSFTPRTLSSEALEKSLYCKIQYKNNSYLSDTVKIVAGEVKITNPIYQQINVIDNTTKIFTTSSLLDNATLEYSLTNYKNEIIDLGTINSYKFIEFGDYVFYAKNSTYSSPPWLKTFVDSTKITVGNIVLNSYDEQFVQLNSNINPLTVSTSLPNALLQWKYGVSEIAIDSIIQGGGTATLNNLPPATAGTYYVKCRITSNGTIQYSSTVKINIIDNEVSPILTQNIEAYKNGTKLSVNSTHPYDSLRWFMESNSKEFAIANATATDYIPRLSPGTWQLFCRFYYHNPSGVKIITTSRVMVQSISASITETTTQYLQHNAYCTTLNIKESQNPTSRQWYYKRSVDGITIEAEQPISNKTGTSMQMYFSKGYHYYVYCKSVFNFSGGDLIIESNEVDLIVPRVRITPQADQPNVIMNSSGEMLKLNITPTDISTTGIKWYASHNAITFDNSTIVDDFNTSYITPELTNIFRPLAYFAKVIFSSGFTSNADDYVCIGTTRSGPYIKDGAYVYGHTFFPRAGVPNNPKFCGTSGRPAGLYWVDLDGYGNNPPVKLYCDGTWTHLGTQSTPPTFTSCGKYGLDGPTQSQINSAYGSYTLMSGRYPVTATNGIQFWNIPTTGTYRVEAFGSKGSGSGEYRCGYGARMRGDINFNKGAKLRIIVGQYTITNSSLKYGGGGGGSFVSLSGTLKIAAGGGGGSIRVVGDGEVEPDGQIREGAGLSGKTNGIGHGGRAYPAEYSGGGGGGWNSDGSTSAYSMSGYGGKRCSGSAKGGSQGIVGSPGSDGSGGFGGGGAGASCPGGGGGYTGGAGGWWYQLYDVYSRGAGGGSYNIGSDQSNNKAANFALGKVIIKYKVH